MIIFIFDFVNILCIFSNFFFIIRNNIMKKPKICENVKIMIERKTFNSKEYEIKIANGLINKIPASIREYDSYNIFLCALTIP